MEKRCAHHCLSVGNIFQMLHIRNKADACWQGYIIDPPSGCAACWHATFLQHVENLMNIS